MNSFEPLRCQGELPSDFVKRTGDRVLEDIDSQVDRKQDSNRDARAKKDFLVESNFLLDDLLMSGQVLFGDEASIYVNKIADRILKVKPELRSQLRFYAVKSNKVNAFATNQGMIFVTLGLLAQLENEAQLAFVLCHELAHFEEKHVITSYVDEQKMKKDRRKYRSEDELVSSLSQYSKEKELEADSLGLILFKKSDYHLEASLSTFDILQFAHLPYDEVSFDFSGYEHGHAHITDELKLDTITPITFDEDYDEPKGSHPAIGERRKRLGRNLTNEQEGRAFLVSEEEFMRVRDICRFEGVRIRLRNRNYVEAIHNIDILLRDFPENEFLLKNKAKALYSIYKYKELYGDEDFMANHKEVEGEISAGFYFFNTIRLQDLRYLTLVTLKETSRLMPEDNFLNEMYLQVLQDVVEENSSLETFQSQVSESILTHLALQDTSEVIEQKDQSADSIDYSSLSKYDKLASLQAAKTDEVEQADYYVMAVEELVSQADFQAEYIRFLTAKALIEKEDEAREMADAKLSTYERKRQAKLSKKQKEADQYKLGVESVVFVDPQYFMVDTQKGVKYLNSEKRQFQFFDQIDRVSDAAKITSTTLTPKLNGNQDVAAFNRLATFKDWYIERSDHDEEKSDWDIILSEQEYVTLLADEMGTDHFALSGIVMFKTRTQSKGTYILGSIFLYPLAPYLLTKAFTPDYDTYLFCSLYNVKTGELEMERTYNVDSKGNLGVMNSYMYDYMIEMKQSKR